MPRLLMMACMVLLAQPVLAATSIKATVNGMVCAFCAQGIERRLTKLSAAKEVVVDLKRRTVAVEAREGHTLDGKQVAAEIIDAGYDVVKLETVAQSAAEIRNELRGR